MEFERRGSSVHAALQIVSPVAIAANYQILMQPIFNVINEENA